MRTDRWLRIFGVPAISAAALGRFRAVLGLALLAVVAAHPVGSLPIDAQRTYSPLVDTAWVRALAASGNGMLALHVLTCAVAALFALGIFARPAYVALVAALFVRTLAILVQRGAHDWGTPLVTLLALLAVPWGDAPPLFGRRRGEDGSSRPHAAASRLYGFAVWLPGLTIGLAFAAAAYAKLHRSGLNWITSGAVRYHFVEDAPNAPVELGMWIATQPRLTVALSLFGVLVEALFILVVLFRGWRARALFGALGASLMAGFYLFQGVRWWAWMILFAAFLPWERRSSAAARTGVRDLTVWHAAIVVVLAAAQVWASYRAIEVEPLLSNYPMYSTTYDSPEYFERAQSRIRFEAEGSDVTAQVEAAEGADVLRATIETADPAPEVQGALAEFRSRYARLHGSAPRTIDVVVLRKPFDWDAGRFKVPVREKLGTVSLEP